MKRPSCALIPAAAVSIGFLLAASLYLLNYRTQYYALLENWGAYPFRTPFLDMHAVTAAVECRRLGIDVYVRNPCDVLQRVHVYSPLWLLFAVFPITIAWDNPLGLATDLTFIASLLFLPPPRGWWQTAVITLCTISGVVAFALERANVDLLVFLLAVLAATLTQRNGASRVLGYAIALLAGMLKFYPVTLLILAMRERLSVFLVIGIVSLGTIGLWFALDGSEILRGMANIPTTSYFDDNVFGMRNLPFGLAQIFQLSHLAAVALLIVLLVAMFAAAAAVARHDDLASRMHALTEPERTYLLVGCVLIVSCFLAAQNGLYRAIHFLFVLPGLTALVRAGGKRSLDGWFLATIALIIVLMWNSAIRMLIDAVVGWFGASTQPAGMPHFNVWLVRELIWWCVISMVTGLFLRLVRESQTAQNITAVFQSIRARRDVIRQASHFD
jgi:hypothetical protein